MKKLYCENCKVELTLHILDHIEEKETLYCPHCQEFTENYSQQCLSCSMYYITYLKSGTLGCADCYTSFSKSLIPLMENYNQRPIEEKVYQKSYQTSSLAKARSLEVIDFLNSGLPTKKIYTKNSKATKEQSIFALEKPSSNIIQSVRLRVARNIHNLKYLSLLKEKQKEALAQIFLSPKGSLRYQYLTFQKAKILCSDEDHLRLIWLYPWTDKRDIMKKIQKHLQEIDILNQLYQWQFHPKYGFLTACPALSGQGIRLSCQMYLEKLQKDKLAWLTWKKNLVDAGLEVRSDKTLEKYHIQVSNRNWAWDTPLTGALSQFLEICTRLAYAESLLAKP